VALTQLIQTFVFWIVNRHGAAVVVHLTPWLALVLQTVTPIALSSLLAAGIGLLLRKPWGRPLFACTAVLWMLAVACLTYWIVAVVNLPVYLLAMWLLYKKGNAAVTEVFQMGARFSVRGIASVACLALSCALHLWAWLAAISPTSWVWRIIRHGHPWHLLVPGAMLLIAGVALAYRSTRLSNAGIALMVFCAAMGDLLVASAPLSTSLYRYLPEPRAYAYLPYAFMIKYLVLLASVAVALLKFSGRGPPA
jgi:hypothetical protein